MKPQAVGGSQPCLAATANRIGASIRLAAIAKRCALVVCLSCLVPGTVLAQTASRADRREGAKLIRQGNQLQADGKYEEAVAVYDQAAKRLPDVPEVDYDRGVALYRQGEYAKAEQSLQDAAAAAKGELEVKARYNLGRCAHASALSQRDNLDAAMNEVSRAIRFYQDAIQVDPNDADARANLEMAERLRAFLERKIEEQKSPTSQPQREPSSQPDDQSTSQPASQPSSRPSSQPSSQPTSQPNQEQSGDSQSGNQGQESNEQGQEGSQEQQAGKQNPSGEQQGDGQEGEEQDAQQAEEQEAGQTQATDQKDGKSARQEQLEKEGEPLQPDEQADGKKPDQDKRKLTREEVDRILQEIRDAEHQRRAMQRERAMRLRGKAKVERDW